MQEPFVSVVVLTRNRAASLTRTLEALAALDYAAYEIVVVNNGSADDTAQVISRFPVRHVFYPRPHIGLCRQLGVEAARGEIIAMCDDDCVPDRAWLRCLISRLESERDIGLVGGRIVNVGFPQAARYKGRGRIGPNGRLIFVADARQADYFGAANQAFKRVAFEAVGGYDPFFRCGYEEPDLILRLKKAGFQVAYEPNAVVEHHFTATGHKLNLFCSISMMRLYFYLKHFRPQTLKSWASFLTYELFLTLKEFLTVPYHLVRTGLRGQFDRWPALATRWINSISTPLTSPWLLWKTRAQRADAGGKDKPCTT